MNWYLPNLWVESTAKMTNITEKAMNTLLSSARSSIKVKHDRKRLVQFWYGSQMRGKDFQMGGWWTEKRECAVWWKIFFSFSLSFLLYIIFKNVSIIEGIILTKKKKKKTIPNVIGFFFLSLINVFSLFLKVSTFEAVQIASFGKFIPHWYNDDPA